ncbi:hypothetical protein MPLA_940002 [Mesorhizobium sp. ORS 3359]|nr:hypothetical protein MPLA_940002 [Mesorhizobium sp. ORS 3359]
MRRQAQWCGSWTFLILEAGFMLSFYKMVVSTTRYLAICCMKNSVSVNVTGRDAKVRPDAARDLNFKRL